MVLHHVVGVSLEPGMGVPGVPSRLATTSYKVGSEGNRELIMGKATIRTASVDADYGSAT